MSEFFIQFIKVAAVVIMFPAFVVVIFCHEVLRVRGLDG
jgi:hypothetical protein